MCIIKYKGATSPGVQPNAKFREVSERREEGYLLSPQPYSLALVHSLQPR